jgi:hypothetical protein
LLLSIAAALVALAWLLHTGVVRIPDRHNPWAPLRIDEPPGWLTRLKLARVGRDAALCASVLAQAEMRYTPLPDKNVGPGCGFSNAVLVQASSVRLNPAFALSCRAAVSLALWERHVLQPAAQAHFGRRAERLEHFGSFACRNVYGRSDAPRSRHATADALDIAGVVLSDGRRIRIVRDWADDDTAARFLRELHAGACRFFDAVLGPEYNAAHRDHFHVERGGVSVCR